MKKNGSMVIGLLIIALGIIFLGNSLDVWNIRIFFKGWWTLFIIIPCLCGLFKDESWTGSILGLCVGVLLLLAAQDLIAWNMVGKIFIPILLIFIGLSIMLRPKHGMHRENVKVGTSKEYIAIFSSSKDKKTDELEDIQITSIFGGVELDLRDCEVKKDVIIDCVSVFGGADIFVPDNVNIKYSGVPIFGGMENKSNNKNKDNKKLPTITVNYVCVFGGIDIK